MPSATPPPHFRDQNAVRLQVLQIGVLKSLERTRLPQPPTRLPQGLAHPGKGPRRGAAGGSSALSRFPQQTPSSSDPRPRAGATDAPAPALPLPGRVPRTAPGPLCLERIMQPPGSRLPPAAPAAAPDPGATRAAELGGSEGRAGSPLGGPRPGGSGSGGGWGSDPTTFLQPLWPPGLRTLRTPGAAPPWPRPSPGPAPPTGAPPRPRPAGGGVRKCAHPRESIPLGLQKLRERKREGERGGSHRTFRNSLLCR